MYRKILLTKYDVHVKRNYRNVAPCHLHS